MLLLVFQELDGLKLIAGLDVRIIPVKGFGEVPGLYFILVKIHALLLSLGYGLGVLQNARMTLLSLMP